MKKAFVAMMIAAVSTAALAWWEAVPLTVGGGDVEVAQVGKVATIIGDDSASVSCVRRTWTSAEEVITNAWTETSYVVQWIVDPGTTNAVTNAVSYADRLNAAAKFAAVSVDTNLSTSFSTNVLAVPYSITTNFVRVVDAETTNTLSANDFVLPGDLLFEAAATNTVLILEH